METKRTGWWSCPQEIQDMILNEVSRDRNSSIAHCAAVCRSWQQVIEKKTFARLTVTLKRLGDFSSMTKKRRHLIKNVWLSIDCAAVGRPTDFALYKTISSLLLELSKWEARGEFHLEISVRWAADSHQCFQYLQTGSDSHHREEPDRTVSPADHSEPARRLHSHCLMHLFARLYHASIRCLFPADFPSVPAVTSLLVRRQTKCEWISREGFNRLLDLLPNLRQIHYEPWRSLEGRNSVRNTRITVEGLHRATFCHNLAKVVVFGDFNEDFDECWRADRRWHRVPISSSRTNPRMASPEIGQAFAQISRPLVHLSLSFAADASDFFETCQRSWIWTRLTSLALTSNLLAPNKDPKIVNDMLEKAGIVALQMPKLDVMELWNGRRGLACVFRYQASRDRAGHNAKITWRSTWPLELEPRVCKAWAAVAVKRDKREGEFDVVKDPEILNFGEDEIRSHGDAIHHLQLVSEVMRPVSLWQIRYESRFLIDGASIGREAPCCLLNLPGRMV